MTDVTFPSSKMLDEEIELALLKIQYEQRRLRFIKGILEEEIAFREIEAEKDAKEAKN